MAWSRGHAAEYGGDPRRLFVAGHSAGAQIAALLGTDARYLAAQGMKPRDLAGVIGLSGPYDFVIEGGYEEVFGPRTRWREAQAVNFVDGDEPPFLLIHGTGDKVVESKDSQELADKLRQAGGKADLVWLPGRGPHRPAGGLIRPEARPQRCMQAIKALSLHLPVASSLQRQLLVNCDSHKLSIICYQSIRYIINRNIIHWLYQIHWLHLPLTSSRDPPNCQPTRRSQMSLINTQVKPFTANAFHNGKFIQVSRMPT